MDGKTTVGWVAMVDNYWDIGSGGDQSGKFKTMAKEKGMSVKDVVLDMVKDEKCGYTRTDVDPQPIPTNGKGIWKGSYGGGFTHQGPCELYIDDKMVFHSDNCEDEYPGGDPKSDQMSEMPVDYSSCNGECMFAIYWVAFQNAQWQAYVNCVPLKGDGSTKQTETKTSNAGSTQGSQTNSKSTENSSKQGDTPSDQAPSTEQKTTQAPSSDQKNQTPSTEKETSQQQSTPAPQDQQKQQQQPQNQQQDQQKQQEEQQKKQQEEQQKQQEEQQKQQEEQKKQQEQTPSSEQRSLDFGNLTGNTGTVQPPTNLRK
ncbi:hypothetical protein PHMEG_00021128 [Phytophthora megakarya]|uniref:Uncharacterized protein n=1 Tax=Phytophthora megakarya TaxID=4795 RepID=A0A225VNA6_9STRA|nr:hypothetical protein PHMEG_00021128 [Phytophthora megakarya]